MAERAKSRFGTKIEEIDDGESVMVEAKYFDICLSRNISDISHCREKIMW